MANGNLTYSVGFTADTSDLSAAISKIQRELNDISLGKGLGSNLTAEINEAATAATKLNSILSNSMNMNTGSLDLSKFANQLKQSGMTLEDYRTKLNQVGSVGTQAFTNVAKAIVQAEQPVTRTSKLLDNLWVSMKNAAKWELSSTAIHGFMGSLQTCYGYAQDLNSSLNNIRIVTENSASQMAEFAQQANNAAKALSTTTQEYTDASLIYFQQGLDDAEVAERTETTIKMANVVSESAETVSEQLTSIWNNFAEAGDNLEYYADVLVRLGADTASSSDEIAAGLQKFSSVTREIGLSYEYAAAALTTITDRTRQNADTVGNSLKTLFSRIQGLSLGETLDDGTDLNKYSQALEKVGISIKDQNGELKDMDTILDEMGAKWQTLSKDQQVALAQTVAGVQQYTRLVSLMDNWDFFQENVEAAKNATGSLEEQQEIYEESWEAARKRVQAAAEEIYDSLIDDDAFIAIDDALTEVLGAVNQVVEAFGGMQGIIVTLGGIMTQIFSGKIATSISNLGYNIRQAMGIEAVKANQLRADAVSSLQAQSLSSADVSEMRNAEIYAAQADAKSKIAAAQNQLNESERNSLSIQESLLDAAVARAEKYNDIAANAQKDVTALLEQAEAEVQINKIRQSNDQELTGNGLVGDAKKVRESINTYIEAQQKLEKLLYAGAKKTTLTRELDEVNAKIKDLNTQEEINPLSPQAKAQLQQYNAQAQELESQLDIVNNIIKAIDGGKTDNYEEELKALSNEAQTARNELDKLNASQDYVNGLNTTARTAAQADVDSQISTAQARLNAAQVATNLNSTLDRSKQGISEIVSGVGGLATSLMSVKNIIDTLSDSSQSAGDKAVNTMMNLTMLLSSGSSVAKLFSNSFTGLQAVSEITQGLAQNTLLASEATGLGAVQARIASAAYGMMGGEATTASLAVSSLAGTLAAVAIPLVAIAAIGGTIWAISEAIETSAEKLAAATESAENLASAASDASSELDAVSTALENYDSAVSALDACTSGTEEWYSALTEVHSQIDSILESYPELLKYNDLFNSDGTLNEDVLEDFQADKQSAADVTQAASLQAEVVKQQAQLEYELSQIKTHTQLGASSSSEYNEEGDWVGSSQSVIEDYAKVQAAFEELGITTGSLEDVAKALDIDLNEISSDQDTLDYLNSLKNTINELGAASDNVAENAAQAVIDSWSEGQDKEISAAQKKLMTAAYKESIDEFQQAINGNQLGAQLGEAFQEVPSLAGKTVAQAFNEAINASLTNEEIREQYTAEDIETTIAAYAALDGLTASAEEASSALSNIADSDLGDAMKSYIANGNFSETNEATRNQLLDENGDFSADKALEALGWTEDFAADKLGQDWASKMENALIAAQSEVSDYVSQLAHTVQDAFNQLKESNSNVAELDNTTQTEIAKAYEQAFETAGQEGIDALNSVFNDPDINTDKLQEIMDVFQGQEDWSSADELAAAIKETGAAAGLSEQQIQDFADSLVYSSNSLEGIGETWAAQKEILDGLEFGDVISEDDFNALGDIADGYFTRMADGTYKLTGDAEEFYNLVQSQTLEGLVEILNRLRGAQNGLSGLSDSDIEGLGKVTDVSDISITTTDNQLGEVSNIDTTALQTMVSLMTAFDEESASAFQNFIDAGEVTESVAQDIIDKFQELGVSSNTLQEIQDALADKMSSTSDALLSEAESVKELQEAAITGNLKDTTSYNKALLNLGKSYDTCRDQVLELEDAMEDLEKAQKTGNKKLEESAKARLKDADAALEQAMANEELQKKVDESYEAITKALDAMEDGQGTIQSSTAELQTIAQSLSDVFGDNITTDFVNNHLADIQRMVNGDEAAFNRIKAALQDEYELKLTVDDSDIYLCEDAVTSLQNWLNSMPEMRIDVNGYANMDDLINDIIASMMTAESVVDAAGNNITGNATAIAAYVTSTFSSLAGYSMDVVQVGTRVITVGYETQTYEVGPGITETSSVAIQKQIPVYKTVVTKSGSSGYSGNPYSGASGNNTSGGGSGGSGGGGGSGSGSEDEPEEPDQAEKIDKEDLVDRFTELTSAMDLLTKAAEQASTATDKLFGLEKIKSLQKENKLIKEQIDLLETDKNAALDYLYNTDLPGMQQALAALGLDTTIEFEYDPITGLPSSIKNIEAIGAAVADAYNAVVDTYNSFTEGGDEQDAFLESTLQPAEDAKDAWSEWYSNMTNDMERANEKAYDQIDKRYDYEENRIEALMEKYEVRLDFSEARKQIRSLVEDIAETLGGALYGVTDQVVKGSGSKSKIVMSYEGTASIQRTNLEQAYTDFNELQKEKNELYDLLEEAKTNPYIDTDDIISRLEEVRDGMLDTAQDLLDFIEYVENMLPDAVSEAADTFDKFIDQLSHNRSIIETIGEIMELQGVTYKTQQGFEDLQDISAKKIETYLGEAQLNRQWYEGLSGQVEAAEAALAQATFGTEEYNILEGNLEALLSEQQDAEEAMYESAEAAMEEAQSMYLQAVEKYAYDLEQTLTNNVGFDLLQDQYDHYIDAEERYLDDVNKLYAMNTLNNKIEQELKKTTDAAQASKLKALQEEFKQREANNKLSQYDVDIMNAKLELTLKQMALEEAQESKSSLRLVRNSQGNWSYQYTADQEDVSDAEQDLLDAQNEYYNIAKNEVKEVTGEIIDTWQEMAEKIQEVYEDTTLTVDEREARIAEIREFYGDKLKDLESDKQKAIADMTEAGSLVIDNFSNQYGTDMDEMSQYVTDFDTVFDGCINDMESALTKYKDTVTGVNSAAGTSYDELKTKLDEVSTSTQKVTEDGSAAVTQMIDQINKVRELSEEYAKLAQAAIEAAQSMQFEAQEIQTTIEDSSGLVFDEDTDYAAVMEYAIKNGLIEYGDSVYNALNEQREAKIVYLEDVEGKDVDFYKWKGTSANEYFSMMNVGDSLTSDAQGYEYTNSDKANLNKIVSLLVGTGGIDYETVKAWLNKQTSSSSVTSLATGGYTGDFAEDLADGKLAFLHEKELVLNADDTQNILSAVNIIRDLSSEDLWSGITKKLESLVSSSQALMYDSLAAQKVTFNNSTQGDTTKEATIYAEFPNVRDARDVEEALYNLANDAAQYASSFAINQ